MKKILFFVFSIVISPTLEAQDRPVFFPEDVEYNTLGLKCLCKPGVTNKSRSRGLDISFLHAFKSSLNEEEGFPLSQPTSELTLQNLTFKLRYPIVNKEGFKAIFGIIYRPEHYDFDKIGVDYSSIFERLNGRILKSSGFEGLLVKSWNETIYSSIRVRTLFNGDYSGLIDFDDKYSVFNISGIVGIKSSPDREWGVGINLSHSFRSTIALPFLLYNHTFDDKWGVEVILPAFISVRYNLSQYSILLLGVRYNSRSYSIEVEDNFPQTYNLNHSEILTGINLEQKIHSWVWVDIATGLQYNFSTDFDALDNEVASFQVEPGATPFVRIGLFISPPDSFSK